MTTPSTPPSNSPFNAPSPSANNQYRHRVIQLVARDWERKTGDKLNRNLNLEATSLGHGQESGSITPAVTLTNTLVATQTISKSTKLDGDKKQVVFGSTGWGAANDGFVKLTKAEWEEEMSFWS
ncbi:hypothetical protein EAF04_005128 [Stromatinia cepivora]|nr:hypothetical protein EAF04_005128 [Stromatinia cepivora]